MLFVMTGLLLVVVVVAWYSISCYSLVAKHTAVTRSVGWSSRCKVSYFRWFWCFNFSPGCIVLTFIVYKFSTFGLHCPSVLKQLYTVLPICKFGLFSIHVENLLYSTPVFGVSGLVCSSGLSLHIFDWRLRRLTCLKICFVPYVVVKDAFSIMAG